MKTHHSLKLSLLTASLVVCAAASATPAFAFQDEAASTPATENSAESAPATSSPASAEPAEPAKSSAPKATSAAPASVFEPAQAPLPPDSPAVTAVGVERLPPSAYPEPYTRGIKGGSLALTFHGLQWPYMPARAGSGSRFVLGLSGWAWDDTSYEKFDPSDNNPNFARDKVKKWVSQGRIVLRATPTYAFDDWFVQAQAEFVATSNQSIERSSPGGADTDDLYLRIGKWNLFDLQVGRFEGWEVFHLGMGLDLNTYERNGAMGDGEGENKFEFYGLTDMQYRPDAAANFAVHAYPLPFLRFEGLGQVGSATGTNMRGARGVGIFDIGWLKLKAGGEYQKLDGKTPSDKTDKTTKGIAGSAQFVLAPFLECGVNAAQGTVWAIDGAGKFNAAGSYTRTSYGGFANARLVEDLILGWGLVYSTKRDQYLNKTTGEVGDHNHLQTFAALQYAIFKQFYVKLVGMYGKANWSVSSSAPSSKFSDTVYSARVRFSFYF